MRPPRCSDEAVEWPDDEPTSLDIGQALALIDLAEVLSHNQPELETQ